MKKPFVETTEQIDTLEYNCQMDDSLSEFTQYESELEHNKENIILNIVHPSRSFTYTKNSLIDNL